MGSPHRQAPDEDEPGPTSSEVRHSMTLPVDVLTPMLTYHNPRVLPTCLLAMATDLT